MRQTNKYKQIITKKTTTTTIRVFNFYAADNRDVLISYVWWQFNGQCVHSAKQQRSLKIHWNVKTERSNNVQRKNAILRQHINRAGAEHPKPRPGCFTGWTGHIPHADKGAHRDKVAHIGEL